VAQAPLIGTLSEHLPWQSRRRGKVHVFLEEEFMELIREANHREE